MFTLKNIHDDEAGFTLVELAVVMIIIGLLIGGVLKGQELIANAQIKATVAQIKAIETAVSAFRDKYNALPGDMTNPGTRLPNCTAAPCDLATGTGRGNGRIDSLGLGTVPTAASEEAVAFSQLSAAGLIAGVQGNSTDIAFGQMLPEAKIGGGFWVGYSSGGASPGLTGLPIGHYIVLNGSPVNVNNTTGPLRPAQAAQIDRIIDDGAPGGGTVRVVGTDCTIAGPPVTYNEASESASCALYIRILN